MAITCTPESLSTAIECLLCIKGERTSEAVKTYLVASLAGNSGSPEQLMAGMVSAGYDKLTMKQCSEGIVWLLCEKGGGTCTPEALNAEAVSFQKFSWQQSQAAIIYLLASEQGETTNPETLVNSAITEGFQNLPLKAMRQIQAWLLATYTFGSLTPKELVADTECFQCLSKYELLAMEVYGYCNLIDPNGIVFNTEQFALTDGSSLTTEFAVATKPQIIRMVLVCTAQDANGFFTWNPGDELDCFGIFDNNLFEQPFACFYQAASSAIQVRYNGESGGSMRYAYGTGPFSGLFNSMNNFSMKVYYF